MSGEQLSRDVVEVFKRRLQAHNDFCIVYYYFCIIVVRKLLFPLLCVPSFYLRLTFLSNDLHLPFRDWGYI